MSHGLIVHRIAGRAHGLRMTLGAYFSIERDIADGLPAAVGRIHRGDFFLTDLVVMLRHLMVGAGADHIRSMKTLQAMKLSDVAGMRLACILAVNAASKTGGEPPSKRKKRKEKTPDVSQADIYRSAFSIGLKPFEVDAMTVWEWEQCIRGFNDAQGAQEAVAAPSLEDVEAGFAELARKERERAARVPQST